MSLFQTPAFFGIQDVTVDSVPSPFGLRIYYPTHDDLTVGAPLARGPHPLVVFAHGNRQGPQNETYCPPPTSPTITAAGRACWAPLRALAV
jgi:hypothetical protein